MKLAAFRIVGVARLIAHGTQQQVQPLVPGKLFAGLNKAVDVPRR